MSDNVIYDSNDDSTIGFFGDLRALLVEQACEFLKSGDYEQAGSLCENLTELDELREYDGLIVLSENNGMGFTATKYGKK